MRQEGFETAALSVCAITVIVRAAAVRRAGAVVVERITTVVSVANRGRRAVTVAARSERGTMEMWLWLL